MEPRIFKANAVEILDKKDYGNKGTRQPQQR